MTETAARERSPRIDTLGFAGNSDIFFAAVSLTRMPMIVTRPSEPDNPIAFANGAFCELTGYAPSELVGRNCRFLQGRDTDPATVARIRTAVELRTDIAVELLNYRRDGTPFWNALFISPVFAPDGTLIYYFASQLDVTRRRDAERALVQAQRLEGLGSLAGGVAHEFNNLLTVIRGNLEPLLRASAAPDVDPRMATRLSRVEEAAERAASLTRSMIAFARRSRLEDQSLDIAALIDTFRPTLAQLVEPRVRLAFDLDLDNPAERGVVQADPEQVRTALTNIVLNAREALPQGGLVTISARTRHARSGRPVEIVVSVQDSGRGMKPEIVARAMDPFFTTKPPGAGAGLGLSMAYGFLRQTGGRLEIESKEGHGTTVRMVFPVQMVDGDVPLADPGETVLVVDDDADLRENAAAMLTDLGYTVLTAATANAALACLRERAPIDLMLTDQTMPHMSGSTLVDRAREMQPGLAVLLTTGFPAAGETMILAKPYTLATLATRVREALDEGGAARRSAIGPSVG
jgi:PAS domain S-box-containing protein